MGKILSPKKTLSSKPPSPRTDREILTLLEEAEADGRRTPLKEAFAHVDKRLKSRWKSKNG